MKKSIGFLTLAAVLSLGAAEPFPNPSMIHRYVGSDTNETWQGVVNNGVVWKRGGGTVTMPAPALNGGGRLNVTAGDVVLDLDAAPTVPTLPDYIVNKIKFWPFVTRDGRRSSVGADAIQWNSLDAYG